MKKNNSQKIKNFISKPLFDERKILNKDSSFPKISVITPSYNQGQFLEKTILSVLNQNYPNLEYIIIDGGSSDGSVDIIKKYEKYLAYWVSEKDKGQSDALNKGFLKATGEIIGWQNSDDVYTEKAFSRAADILEKYRDADIVFSHRLDIDKDDNLIGETRFTPFSVVGYWYEGMSLSNQSVFWRKEMFSKIGVMDVNLHVAMDYEFFLRAALKGVHFKFVPEYWGAIRRHNASKGNTLWAEHMKKECDIIDKQYARLTCMNLPLKIYSLLRRSFYYFIQGDEDYLIKGFFKRLNFDLFKKNDG